MSYVHPAWVEHQRRRWMRPDASRYLKRLPWESWQQFELRCAQAEGRDDAAARKSAAFECDATLRDQVEFSRLVAEIKLDILHLRRLLKAYNPNQPRVPAGNPDGGQWSGGGGARTRLAAADKPRELS